VADLNNVDDARLIIERFGLPASFSDPEGRG
jgi:hypothetical protein